MSIIAVPRFAVIVVAAGSGTRLGAGAPKAFVDLGGHTILRRALDGVFATKPTQVVIVAPADLVDAALADAWAAGGDHRDVVSVVAGGSTRQDSVASGLAAVWPDVDYVLVHDAARALTPPDVFARVVTALSAGAAAVIPAVPVVDTLKRVTTSVVVAAVDRAELVAAQTPQGFSRQVLSECYADAGADFTDDAALVQAAGYPVVTVAGAERAFKITAAADLERARLLLGGGDGGAVSSTPSLGRVGVGTDVHGFADTGVLWLAGLEWPGERALSGHSDGDAVAHAIVDALLSAAGLGDIGTHFGTDKPEYSGAHASAFLGRTAELLAEAGWGIGNVSVQVQANRPRFSARRAEAEEVLSLALGGAAVSVAATTTDGLGFTGRSEGVAAFAVAYVVPL